MHFVAANEYTLVQIRNSQHHRKSKDLEEISVVGIQNIRTWNCIDRKVNCIVENYLYTNEESKLSKAKIKQHREE